MCYKYVLDAWFQWLAIPLRCQLYDNQYYRDWNLHVQKTVAQGLTPDNKFKSQWYPRVFPAKQFSRFAIARQYSTRQYFARQFLARLITFRSVCWRKYKRHAAHPSLQISSRWKYSFSNTNICLVVWVRQGEYLSVRTSYLNQLSINSTKRGAWLMRFIR
jgi:hypothetical protein